MNNFSRCASLALIASLAVHWLSSQGKVPPSSLIACNILILIVLSTFAIREQRRTMGAFDTTVAAETLVAFGVLALILGLAVALYPLMASGDAPMHFDADTLRQLSIPFLQGLATAAIAPVIAVIVRNMSVGDGADDPSAELSKLSRKAAELSAELNLAGQQARALAGIMAQTVNTLAPFGQQLDKHADEIERSVGRLAPALDSGLKSVADTVEARMTKTADLFDAVHQKLDGAGTRCGAELDNLATRADAAGTHLTKTGEAMRELRESAAQTGGLLDAFGTMVESVERFVQTRAARP